MGGLRIGAPYRRRSGAGKTCLSTRVRAVRTYCPATRNEAVPRPLPQADCSNRAAIIIT